MIVVALAQVLTLKNRNAINCRRISIGSLYWRFLYFFTNILREIQSWTCFSFMIAKQPENVAKFSTTFILVKASELSFYFELSYSNTLR